MNRRHRLATVLLLIAALAAAVAAISSFPLAADAAPAHRLAEHWRAWGLLVFAGLFAVLALRPVPAAVWWLVIGHKVALTVTAMSLLRTPGLRTPGLRTPGAVEAAVVDGVLVLVLAAAWWLRRSARSSLQGWPTPSLPTPSTPRPAPSSSARPDART